MMKKLKEFNHSNNKRNNKNYKLNKPQMKRE
jgi:hypothetical protein